MFDNFMELALQQAEMAMRHSEVPVGAVIVKGGKIIAAAHNNTALNPLAHAEILAINQALASVSGRSLPECDMYVTLEPCPMCKYALSLVKIRRIYFGAYERMSAAGDFAHNHSPEEYGGILEQDCAALLGGFFAEKRTRRNA